MFQDIEDQEAFVPEHLKNMLVAEIDVIRDTMQIVQMFLGEFPLVAVKMLQVMETKK
jgi:hypothetical protein